MQDQHFQSLERIPSAAVPCCNIEAEVEEVEMEEVEMEEILGNVDLQVEVEDIDAKLMAEEVVLTTNLMAEKVVEESLARIR